MAAAVGAGVALTATDHNNGIAAATFDTGETLDCGTFTAETTIDQMFANFTNVAPAGSKLRGVDISGRIASEIVLNVCL